VTKKPWFWNKMSLSEQRKFMDPLCDEKTAVLYRRSIIEKYEHKKKKYLDFIERCRK
jgi:hypothetical protein